MKQRRIERIRAKLKRTIKQIEKLNLEFEFCMEAGYPLSSKKMIFLDEKM